MLTIKGKVLDVTVETVQLEGRSPFDSTTIHLLSGEGSRTRVEQVRTAKDFPAVDLPKKDETAELEVFVSAYATKGGAGFRLTAVARVRAAGLRAAATA